MLPRSSDQLWSDWIAELKKGIFPAGFYLASPKKLIRKLMDRNPQKRPNLSDVIVVVNKWIRKGNEVIIFKLLEYYTKRV